MRISSPVGWRLILLVCLGILAGCIKIPQLEGYPDVSGLVVVETDITTEGILGTNEGSGSVKIATIANPLDEKVGQRYQYTNYHVFAGLAPGAYRLSAINYSLGRTSTSMTFGEGILKNPRGAFQVRPGEPHYVGKLKIKHKVGGFPPKRDRSTTLEYDPSEEIKAWETLAAEPSYANSPWLAKIQQRQTKIAHSRGETEDDHALIEGITRLAQQGNPEAQYHLGMMYNNGWGVQKESQKAFEWFSKAAASGDPLGAFKLGCYYGGQFQGVVDVDLNKALEYKLIAAKAGYSLAQHDVGASYYKQDKYDEALTWWKLAAEQGYPQALYNLSVIYKEGKASPKDPTLTYAYFKLAKLASEKQINQNAKATLYDMANSMSPAELEKAEKMVSLWKPQPTTLTIKAAAGIEEAAKLVKAAEK